MKEWTVYLGGKEFTLEQLRNMTDEELMDFLCRLCEDRFEDGVHTGRECL